MKTSRRQFLARSAAGAALALTSQMDADPLGMPIGTQSWPMRHMIEKDFPGTLKQLAAIGYQNIEMCSPPGYKNYGFGGLANMSGAEMRRVITDAGMHCESCHFGRQEFKDDLDGRIAFAKDLGLKQMILSTFNMPPSATLDDWRKSADWYNTVGEKIQSAGIQAGYHNHDFEFKKYGDTLVYDALMSQFDPKLIRMQFQVAVISLGYKAADYFHKYPGRFISMHCADWSPETKKDVPLGKGIVDWKATFEAAKTGGIANYFVEVDNFDDTKASYPYVHALQV